VQSARARLEGVNPEVRVVAHQCRLDAATAPALLADYDVVVEGSDNLATKLAVSDAAVALGRPCVVAGVAGWDGQLLVVRPGQTACYRCLVRAVPPAGAVPTCAEAGILGPVAGVVGSLQAVEALRLCLGLPSPVAGALLLYDGRAATVTAVAARRDPRCPACAGIPT
jgi:adenylyltransferase/sulfurtransferase